MSKGMKKAVLAAFVVAVVAWFVISLIPTTPTKFIIKPVAIYEGKVIALGSAPLVMPEGTSFVLNLSKSSVPSPPVSYLY